MGITKWLWLVPLKNYQGKPKGNGIDWGENEEDLIPSSYRADANANNINEENKDDNFKKNNIIDKDCSLSHADFLTMQKFQ